MVRRIEASTGSPRLERWVNAASAWRGRDAPSVADFHVALALGALLSLAASVRYLSLPKDAGRHVSAGRGG